MRITNKTLSNNFLQNLNRNLARMQKNQNQLSSGKLISKPSDDPLGISKIMDIKNNISFNEQYMKNIDDTIGWVESQDNSMMNLISNLHRVRDLTIYAASGDKTHGDRQAVLREIEQTVESIRDVLNANFDGRYIFAGHETKTPPFSVGATGLEYHGDNNNMKREIGNGINVNVLASGLEIVGGGNELGILLNDIMNAIDTDDTASLSGSILSRIDERFDHVLAVQSRIGATANRLEAAKARNESEKLNLSQILSQREDIDVAEKYMEYSILSTVYQASLSVGSKILQPSLLDFLR